MNFHITDGVLHIPSWGCALALPPIMRHGPYPKTERTLFGVAVEVRRMRDGLRVNGAAILCPNGWGLGFEVPTGAEGEGRAVWIFWSLPEPVTGGTGRDIVDKAQLPADFDADFPALLADLADRGPLMQSAAKGGGG
jgi:hypothetical protein